MRTVREYDNYEDYIKHQKEKSLNAQRIEQWLGEQWEPKVRMFTVLIVILLIAGS